MSAPAALCLREVEPEDLDRIFEDQRDSAARWMAAFGAADPDDRTAFDAKFAGILADPDILTRTIEVAGAFAGYLVSFRAHDTREVGYWITRSAWGQGIATAGLRLFLEELEERPLHARVAEDNAGSIRVLEKCGFQLLRRERGYAHGRGAEIDEVVMVLPPRPR